MPFLLGCADIVPTPLRQNESEAIRFGKEEGVKGYGAFSETEEAECT